MEIPMIGARKIPRLAMKSIKLEAPVIIFQGTMIQPPIRVAKKAALRRLMYFGNKLVRSFETEMTFAETLTPICAMHQASPQ